MHERDEELVTLPRAAKEIGISRASAYTWALAGRIPARRIAGRYVITRAELKAVVARERRKQRTHDDGAHSNEPTALSL